MVSKNQFIRYTKNTKPKNNSFFNHLGMPLFQKIHQQQTNPKATRSGFPFQVLAGCSPEASGLQPAVGFPLQSLMQNHDNKLILVFDKKIAP